MDEKFKIIEEKRFDSDWRNVVELVLKDGDKRVGTLEVVSFKQPFQFVLLNFLHINPDYQNQKLGKGVLEFASKKLIENNKIGVLENSISANEPTRDIYEKAGWKYADAEEVWMYLSPDGNKPENLEDIIKYLKGEIL